MKKLYCLLIACIFSVFLFAGCGYSGGETVAGIAFTSNVFYVDEQVPTKLGVKVFPSSANASDIRFNLSVSDFDVRYVNFDREKGIISINDDAVSEVKVTVLYGSYEDECMVYLKSYPSRIKFDKDSIILHAGGMTQLSYLGIFESETKSIDTSFYHTKLVSSDPSVISVEDSENLIIKSTGRSGSASLTASMVKSNGEIATNPDTGVELKASIKINVVNTIKNCSLLINDSNLIRNISRSDAENFTSITYTVASINSKIDINPIFTDIYDFIIDESNFEIISNNTNIVKVVNEELVIVGAGTTEILIIPSFSGEDGTPIMFKIKLQINLST